MPETTTNVINVNGNIENLLRELSFKAAADHVFPES